MNTNNRRDCNFLIQNIIKLYLEIYPELRYIQALWGLGIINRVEDFFTGIPDEESEIEDRFYEEPYDTIVRMLPKIIKLVNEDFPSKENQTVVMKLYRANIFTHLEELGLATKTADFKLVPKE